MTLVQVQEATEIQWTPYLATAYAEGFCEGEGASAEDQIKAWAYLIQTKLCWHLQGWFGRNAQGFIQSGIISRDGIVDWDAFETAQNA